jgi:hypothetical protein
MRKIFSILFFIVAAIFNVSYGQTKTENLTDLFSLLKKVT